MMKLFLIIFVIYAYVISANYAEAQTCADTPGSVITTGNMNIARAAHTATLLPTGKVLIAGGFNAAYAASTEIYDPATGKFLFGPRMAVARSSHTATLLPNGKVLIAGGFNGSILASAEIFDPATGKFLPTGSLITARSDHRAVPLQNGQILVLGGVGNGFVFLDNAELYDPITGLFKSAGNMTVARESHTTTLLQDGRVLITGGHRGRQSAIVIYDSAEIYNPTTAVFSTASKMTIRRHKHDAVLLADGRVLITGGSDERDDLGVYRSAEIYDPMTNTFRNIGNMPTIRYKHQGTSLLLLNGKAFIAGGSRNALIYDPVNNLFTSITGDLGSAELSRLFSTATLLPDQRVLITGGYGLGQNVSAMAWIYCSKEN